MYQIFHFFDIDNIAFELFSYKLCYLELAGVISGYISVFLAGQGKKLNFVVGFFNSFFYAVLFYQVHLYADMFLQIYFFFMSLFGLYNWSKNNESLAITTLKTHERIKLLAIIAVATLLLSFFFSNIHILFPYYFEHPNANPIADSFILFASVIAMYFMSQKILENWILWIMVNLVATFLYASKDLYFTAIQYFVFLIFAVYAYIHWKKKICQ